jgi:hypothetical protein
MIVDLNPLPYRLVLNIIDWCLEHNIDREKCIALLAAWKVSPPPDIEWTLDIPEKYVDWLLLKLT